MAHFQSHPYYHGAATSCTASACANTHGDRHLEEGRQLQEILQRQQEGEITEVTSHEAQRDGRGTTQAVNHRQWQWRTPVQHVELYMYIKFRKYVRNVTNVNVY